MMSTNGQTNRDQGDRPEDNEEERLRLKGPLVSLPQDLGVPLPRPVRVQASNMPAGRHVLPHRHSWCQLTYAAEGLMAVYTEQGNWVVPPERAVWIPAHTDHEVFAPHGAKFRSLHLELDFAYGMPDSCCVLSVSPLLKEMLIHAAGLPADYEIEGSDGRFLQAVMDQIRAARAVPLHLPMPQDPRLRRITEALLKNPADNRGLEELSKESGASSRTLARLFSAELGVTFRQWRSQCRLMASMERLALGEPVTTVALDLGYDSPSAFIAMFKRALGKTPTVYFGGK